MINIFKFLKERSRLKKEIKKSKEDVIKKMTNIINSSNNLTDEIEDNLFKPLSKLNVDREWFDETLRKLIVDSLSELIIKKKDKTDGQYISPIERKEIDDEMIRLSVDKYDQVDEDGDDPLEDFEIIMDVLEETWHIMNDELKPITVNFKLGKGEVCYYLSTTTWGELVKGYDDNGEEETLIKDIEDGKVYFTNKRIIFKGEIGNKTINLNKIFEVDLHPNGLYVSKETGKSPIFQYLTDTDYANIILKRLVFDE